MTLIELLSPRYKVIAPWPGMDAEPFHLGQVVTLQRHVIEDGHIWIHMPIKHMPNSYMRQEFFDNFSHLFKKLEWWEDRKPEDMQGLYIRSTANNASNGGVFKIKNHYTSDGHKRHPLPYFTTEEDSLGWYYHTQRPGIITKAEYDAVKIKQ